MIREFFQFEELAEIAKDPRFAVIVTATFNYNFRDLPPSHIVYGEVCQGKARREIWIKYA